MNYPYMIERASIFLLIILLTAGCSSPLSELMLLNVQDEIPPELVIISPENESSYASTVKVTETVDLLPEN